MTTRVVTWNLQGRRRPDLDEVARHVLNVRADLALLQEVQRGQARELAATLGWCVEWRFKHWPVLARPEGLAVLSREPVAGATTVVLAHRWRWWSWRRRIAIAATVGGLGVVDTHLGAGVDDEERVRHATVSAAAVPDPVGFLAGDLNAAPGSDVLHSLAAAGLRDAWAETRPGEAGPTNWPPGPRDRPPTQRLDYVLVGEALRVLDASLPDEPSRFAALSDHLPLAVTVDRG